MPDVRTITGAVSIVLGGEAGQGVQTVEAALTLVMKRAGYHVFAWSEFMSRIRGGSNSTEIRVSAHPVTTYIDTIDILVPLDRESIPHLRHRITDRTVIIGDREALKTDLPVIDVPFARLATETGGAIYANMIASGLLTGLMGVDAALLDDYVRSRFGKKSEDVVAKNIDATRKGYAAGRAIAESVRIDIHPEGERSADVYVTGYEAVGMGCIAGGCNFIASYPMSPSTGVLTFLSQQARAFGILVDQAEDEIAAINMGLGASYAGARALATSSGGGFALMGEGVSLAGMIETPIVIHIGQRPGPATGLPTRTEQGDLELALYAGHGEFPRIILTPRHLQDAFYLSKQAFTLAARHQSPVFIITDEYLLDGSYNTPAFDPTRFPNESHVVETEECYQRYAITPDGVSPRGIPSLGKGIVAVDSDEHTEAGYITESEQVRNAMVEKRLRKGEAMAAAAMEPEWLGAPDATTLVVCWGSTYQPVREALERLARRDVAMLSFGQVYPVPRSTADLLRRSRNLVLVENNATAQFGKLLKLATGIAIDKTILKYSGMPFSVEELVGKIGGCL